MRAFNSWKWQLNKTLFDGGTFGLKMRPLPFMVVVCTVMLFIVYRTTNYQYRQTELERRLNPFYTLKDSGFSAQGLGSLPQGIINSRSDLELKPLWSSSSSKSKVNNFGSQNLLAIPVGLKQKDNVDIIVRKFLPENFTIILFHYDGNVDGWWDLQWSKKAIHIVGLNQTKWWFAKRFLHPAVVSAYDYIFLWDEDLGVENFHPGRYLKIIKSAGLEISQPALDPNSTGIHHRITIRKRTDIFHKRVYDFRGSVKCSDASDGPPCAGFVEGMAPVFSRAAWICAWHLIQSDLVHGWGMDMKLGYCAQLMKATCYFESLDVDSRKKETYCELAIGVGINSRESTVYDCEGDRTKKVGVVDSEYLVHQSIQTLGGPSTKKASSVRGESIKKHTVDARAEIRRQATSELQEFEDRWDKAVKEDKSWEDPYKASPPNRKRRRRSRRRHSKV